MTVVTAAKARSAMLLVRLQKARQSGSAAANLMMISAMKAKVAYNSKVSGSRLVSAS